MIVVNGRFLTQEMTGVQRFALGILTELLRIRSDVRIVAPKSAPILHAADLDMDRIGRFRGHLWEQVELPRYLRSIGSPVLLSLSSTSPAGYANSVTTHHDIIWRDFPESFPWRFRALYGFIIPRMLRNCKSVITSSVYSQIHISEEFGIDREKFIVVPGAADGQFISSAAMQQHEGSDDETTPYFLSVGSRSKHKNFSRLIDAFKSVSDDIGEIELRIVGSTQRSLSADSEEEIPAGVVFEGRVSDARLASLYRGALAYVFPSLAEGFGIPPLEAQQFGCPVIASDAASIPEVLGESAGYFDPREPASISTQMRRIAQDSEWREELRTLGFKNARRFSWRRSAALVSQTIDSFDSSHTMTQ